MASKASSKVLVLLGENTRVVCYNTTNDLKGNILETFKDVIEGHDFFLQVKSEEWGGLFVDLNDDEQVLDKSVIKAVIKPKKKHVNQFRCFVNFFSSAVAFPQTPTPNTTTTTTTPQHCQHACDLSQDSQACSTELVSFAIVLNILMLLYFVTG